MADSSQNAVMMYDIRSDKSEASLLDMMKEGLDGSAKTMPTLLLYDEKGLKLFEKITYLDQYYLTNAEIEALTRNADEIAEYIPNNARVIELGSGNLRKVNIILKALERAKKHVDYYALDLSLPELQRTFAELKTSEYKYVRFNALHGTYDDGLAWLAASQKEERVSCILSLGSSIGNFERGDAADFLTKYRTIMKPFDVFIIGLDACADPERVYAAYNDSEGVTEQFYRNGLRHANELFGYDAFKQDQWEVKGEYVNNEHTHKACYIAREDVKTKDFSIKKGERLPFEHSDKYSQDESDQLWHNAGLIPRALFRNEQGDYHVHILRVSGINFSTDPSLYAKAPSPSLGEWQRLWTAWDTVTLSMAPRDELMEKPIKLRNDLIFYLGHIPTFADIHFTKATAEKPTQPAMYYQIFERGIDPDVDDPTQCHSHSEIPDDWPALPEILAYQRRVRNRVTAAIESGRVQNDRRLARGLWLAYEHEAMHLETFLYMLSQSDRILPPPGIPKPNFEALAKLAQAARSENKWHTIPASQLQIGLDDPQNNEGPDRFFTWDNETPARQVSVHSFQAQSRPISIGDYVEFLDDTKQTRLPASWIDLKHVANGMNGHINGILYSGAGVRSSLLDSKAVRTFFGPVPLKFALDWPVMASYDELAAFAEWSGGRIPTFEELRSIYHYVDRPSIDVENTSSSLVPAVNGHLSNEGVEETPPQNGLLNGAAGIHANSTHPEPTDAFINLDGRNVGFKGWHTVPVTGEGHRLRGQSDVGGLWEWSSTSLFEHDGFAPMPLYPGYTADFFDDKHNICLGGSWATVPRIAGRKSFVNWYQRNYPYAWCTARLARDHA